MLIFYSNNCFYRTLNILINMKKGQGSMTYLLLIAGGAVIAIAIIVFIISIAHTAEETTEESYEGHPLVEEWTKWKVACVDISDGYTIEMKIPEPEKFDTDSFGTEDWIEDTIMWCPAEEEVPSAIKTEQQITITGIPTTDYCDQFVVDATGNSVTFTFNMVGAGWNLFYANPNDGTVQLPITGSEQTVFVEDATDFPDVEAYILDGLPDVKLCMVFTEEVA